MSEATALHELTIDIAEEPRPTPLQREVVDRTPHRVKALTNVIARVAYPVDQLAAWIAKDRHALNCGRIYVDASVCESVSAAGESRSMTYLSKSQGVDLLWLRDILRHLNIVVIRIPSERNLADILTKAIARKILEALLPILGRR